MKSRTIAEHLLRGVLGFAFLWVTLHYMAEWGWWALAPAAAALVCFRGCPLCWTVGLVETAISGKAAECVDGSCAPK